jgi:hypothetical protein
MTTGDGRRMLEQTTLSPSEGWIREALSTPRLLFCVCVLERLSLELTERSSILPLFHLRTLQVGLNDTNRQIREYQVQIMLSIDFCVKRGEDGRERSGEDLESVSMGYVADHYYGFAAKQPLSILSVM